MQRTTKPAIRKADPSKYTKVSGQGSPDTWTPEEWKIAVDASGGPMSDRGVGKNVGAPRFPKKRK